MSQKLLTIKELCEVLGVHRATVWNWRNAGMPVVPWGPSRVRFDLEQVNEWVRGRGENGKESGRLLGKD